jgi:hypothetical protein
MILRGIGYAASRSLFLHSILPIPAQGRDRQPVPSPACAGPCFADLALALQLYFFRSGARNAIDGSQMTRLKLRKNVGYLALDLWR